MGRVTLTLNDTKSPAKLVMSNNDNVDAPITRRRRQRDVKAAAAIELRDDLFEPARRQVIEELGSRSEECEQVIVDLGDVYYEAAHLGRVRRQGPTVWTEKRRLRPA